MNDIFSALGLNSAIYRANNLFDGIIEALKGILTPVVFWIAVSAVIYLLTYGYFASNKTKRKSGMFEGLYWMAIAVEAWVIFKILMVFLGNGAIIVAPIILALGAYWGWVESSNQILLEGKERPDGDRLMWLQEVQKRAGLGDDEIEFFISSSDMNAYAAVLSPQHEFRKVIMLGGGLWGHNLTDAEREFVVLHELGHLSKGHSFSSIIAASVSFPALAVEQLFKRMFQISDGELQNYFQLPYSMQRSIDNRMKWSGRFQFFVKTPFTLAALPSMLIKAGASRLQEKDTDIFAFEHGADPQEAAKFFDLLWWKGGDVGGINAWSSHPAIRERRDFARTYTKS